METLRELRRLGYTVWVDGPDIRYRYVGMGMPDSAQVRPWLQVLHAEKEAALAALRAETAEGWPPESLACEARFGHRAARLYPFLGRRVATPRGPGQLCQVLEARCRVLLEGRAGAEVEVPAAEVRPAQGAET